LESFGIVCEHVIAVLVYLNIVILPESLVMKRWTKNAKDGLAMSSSKNNLSVEPTSLSQFTTVVERCKRMAVAVVKCGKPQLLRSTLDLVDAQTKLLENECSNDAPGYVNNSTLIDETILNLCRVRTKGCGASTSSSQARKKVGATTNKQGGKNVQGRKPKSCGVCNVERSQSSILSRFEPKPN
jgi:hypothetical protein